VSVSIHVVGFKPPDEKWRKMKAVWDACTQVGVNVPPEVVKFFDGGNPDPTGVEVSESNLVKCGALREWDDKNSANGYEVDLKKVPADVTVIRFYRAW